MSTTVAFVTLETVNLDQNEYRQTGILNPLNTERNDFIFQNQHEKIIYSWATRRESSIMRVNITNTSCRMVARESNSSAGHNAESARCFIVGLIGVITRPGCPALSLSLFLSRA